MKTYALRAFVGFIALTPSLFGQTNTSADSPRDQLQQLTTQLQNSPDDQVLREKIINMAKTVAPRPRYRKRRDAAWRAGLRPSRKQSP